MPDPIDLVMSRLGDPVYINFPEHIFFCPFCPDKVGSEDRKGHLYVNEERGYFCHRCESRGRIWWLLKVLGVSKTEMEGSVPEVIELRRDVLIHSIANVTAIPDPGVQLVDLPDNVDDVWNVPAVWTYAQSRGLNRFYCEYYGLMAWIDNLGNERLLFPDYTDKALVYWTARAVKDDVHPKYDAAKGSEKSFCVWNLNRVDVDYPIYVTEGVMSARSCGNNGVAIYGHYLSDAQTSLIARRSGAEGVRLVLDSDARQSSINAAEKFVRRGVPCGVVTLPGEKTDPDDLPVVELQQLLIDCKPLGEFGLERLRLKLV